MKSALTTRFVLSAAAFLAAAASHADAQWATQSLHPVGAVQSAVWGLGDGQMTGIADFTGGSQVRAALWDMQGAYTDLHPQTALVSMGMAAAGGVQVGETYNPAWFPPDWQFATVWAGTRESFILLSPMGFDAYATDGRFHAGAAYVGDEVHAVVWDGTTGTWEDLDPVGSTSSYAWGAGGGQQCGSAVISGLTQAGYWNGTAGTWVNLNPFEGGSSQAYGTDGVQQVGWTQGADAGHACLWNGNAESWVDLRPDGSIASYAYDVEGGYQAGGVYANGSMHAALWQGTKESWLDLHQYLPAEYQAGYSEAWAIWVDGPNIYVGGDALNAVTGQMEAILWKFEVNRPPVAEAGSDQMVYVDPDTNTAVFGLDGSASTDPDGDTLTYEWTDPIGQTIDTAWMGATQTPGTYVYTLKVTDPEGLSDTDTVTVTVMPANHPPVADAGPDQTVTVPHDGDPNTRTATFPLMSAGSDPDNDPLWGNWYIGTWNIGGGVLGSVIQRTQLPGSYTFELRVTDPASATGIDQVSITVLPEPNLAPKAKKDSYEGAPGEIVDFDVLDNDSDPDGDAFQIIGQTFTAMQATCGTVVHLGGTKYRWIVGSSLSGYHWGGYTIKDPYGAATSAPFSFRVKKK